MTRVADCMMSFFRSVALPLLGATVLMSQPFWMYLRTHPHNVMHVLFIALTSIVTSTCPEDTGCISSCTDMPRAWGGAPSGPGVGVGY